MNVWLAWLLWSLAAVLVPFAYLESRSWWRPAPNVTLSQTVWRLEKSYPIFGVALAFIVGLLLGGLAIHFFGLIPACKP